ncbi:MFS general substrate transporter [Coniophora puteana RWD-64-598 SS2]|uniref:MFS general substrate transporter n=1 Tax=Coniophora puteana (strain RWD-64-598) TaxID=741705 RepID=A0A5M3MSN2_CONPW|nr:MFS general substrate transporter [Coniophora puteana RWD-64-598 SS2]EIW81744.1 MFS general substrate transporter [Coniophora puteana RWD-64-598 SS2]
MSFEEKPLGEKAIPRDDLVSEVDETQYAEILRRHGRLDLVPMPSDSPVDPLNWPSWKKNILLFIVSFHAAQGPLGAAIIIPAFQEFVEDLGVTLVEAPYSVSIEILFMGVSLLAWAPLSERIGRRPVYLISALLSAVFALGGAYTNSWGALITTRIFQSIFIAPALSIGASTVDELFFSYQRGQKMGIWVLFVTIGPIIGPLISGYLVQNKGWRSALFLLAAIHLGIFFAHFILGPETLFLDRTAPGQPYNQDEVAKRTDWRSFYTLRVFSTRKYQTSEFFRPVIMITRPVVLLPTLAYSITYTYTNVLMTIFVPQLFGAAFGLTPGQIGLQFIALLIGSLLGELVAGRGSDAFVNWRARRRVAARDQVSEADTNIEGQKESVVEPVWHPEDRLMLAPPGFIIAIVGFMIWGVQLQDSTGGKWNVTPDVGSAIALFGLQLITTVCVTYSIESYRSETSDVSVFISLVRQLYAFVAPFYLSIAYTNLGDIRASGLFSGIIGLAMFMTLACSIWGPYWRSLS